LLFYNDYDAEGVNAKSNAIYTMLKDFKKRGVPIDGVGLQMHISNLSTDELASLDANIKRLTDLALQVHITEMDVALPIAPNGMPLDEGDLTKQANIYRHVANSCLQNKRCTALQAWGFTDKYSWLPGFTKGAKGSGLLFTKSYERKAAYDAWLEVLQRQGSRNRAGRQ
jgi:endo-1,4-beta-xylanase